MNMTAQDVLQRRVLARFSRTKRVDGVLVTINCTEVTNKSGGIRYEVRIRGDSQVGIYDVPREEFHLLDQRIDQMVTGFMATYDLRQQ